MIPSHVAFVANIANLLSRNGHKVVVIDSVLRSDIGNKLDTNYIEKVVEVDTAENVTKSASKSEIPLKFWSMNNEPEEQKEVMEHLGRLFLEQCRHLVLESNVLRELESMKFDFGMHEVFDVCGIGIFERLKIRRSVILSSTGMRDIVNEALGISGPLYDASILSDYGSHVPLFETRRNLKFHSAWRNFFEVQSRELEPLFRVSKSFETLLRYSNLMFVNTHELADAHRPWSRRVHEIGGISFKTPKKLENEYTDIFTKFPGSVVLVSFGTTTPSFLMPSKCKNTLKRVFEKLPEVLFIWKYEKEDNFTKSFKGNNVMFRKYIPQVDLLESGRISLFITHGGQNSLLETFHANVRSLVVPLFGDQHRNARIARENGLAEVLEKRDLSNEELVESAVKRALSVDKTLAAKLQRISTNLRGARESAERLLISSIEATYGVAMSSEPPPNFESFPKFYTSDDVVLILDTLIFVSLVAILRKLLFV